MTTRINYVTDLKNLAHHAGNRLCTQAQFEWRLVFIGMVNAIRNYSSGTSWDDGLDHGEWQFEHIADSALFRPICYQLGRCPFKASFDRACSIRARVDDFASYSVPSSEWGPESIVHSHADLRKLEPINNAEWLLDPAAARHTSGGAGHD
jgi:hypothetical protein